VRTVGPGEAQQGACEVRACPCTDGVCALSRYARAVAAGDGNHEHTLAATERAVAERISGLQIDMAAMAVVQNVYRAATAVRNHLERTVLAPYQLTWTGWVVLWVVWIWEEIETRHVAVEAGISKGTLTGVVKTLEAHQWLRREAHPQDARRVLLSLTSEGSSLMQRLFPEFNAQESALTARLGVAARRELAQLLRAVITEID
jgi:MarR family transcriptional regulator, organic hydroperoxide resistance regulator